MFILRLIFRVRRLVFLMLFQNRMQAVAEPAIPSGSWLISRVQPLRHPSGGNSSAWLFLAQLAWLSQAEPSSGNTTADDVRHSARLGAESFPMLFGCFCLLVTQCCHCSWQCAHYFLFWPFPNWESITFFSAAQNVRHSVRLGAKLFPMLFGVLLLIVCLVLSLFMTLCALFPD